MTTSLAQVAQAVGDRVQAMDPRLNWTGYIPPVPQFPCAFLTPPSRSTVDLGVARADVTFDLVFMVARNDLEGQKALWDYAEAAGDFSVQAMFQEDRGVGFDDVDVYCGDFEFMGLQELGGYTGFSSRFSLLVSLG